MIFDKNSLNRLRIVRHFYKRFKRNCAPYRKSNEALASICLLLGFSIILVMYVLQTCTAMQGSVTYIRSLDRNSVTHKTTEYARWMPSLLWWGSSPRHQHTIVHCGNLTCKVYRHTHNPKFNFEAYLFNAFTFEPFNLPPMQKRSEDIWALHYEESTKINRLLRSEHFELFNYSSTFSLNSDVPYPMHYFLEDIDSVTDPEYYIGTTIKRIYGNTLAPVVFVHHECDAISERNIYVKELMKFIPIDNYGPCLKNKYMPRHLCFDYISKMFDDKFYKFIARYKFAIAIENTVCEDYTTEKLWRAIIVGAVPIYFGSPSIKEWLPNTNSAILIEDFPTPNLLSDYLYKLLADDLLYEKHLVHKTKGVISNQKLIYEFKIRPYQKNQSAVFDTFECYICRKVYEKKWIKGRRRINQVNRSHHNCYEENSAMIRKHNITPTVKSIKFYKDAYLSGKYIT